MLTTLNFLLLPSQCYIGMQSKLVYLINLSLIFWLLTHIDCVWCLYVWAQTDIQFPEKIRGQLEIHISRKIGTLIYLLVVPNLLFVCSLLLDFPYIWLVMIEYIITIEVYIICTFWFTMSALSTRMPFLVHFHCVGSTNSKPFVTLV